MGFEFGIAKTAYTENINWSEDCVYFYWCGWDNVELFKAFANLSDEKYPSNYEGEYKVALEKLDFIERVYNQLYHDENYAILDTLMEFDDDFIYEYFEKMPIKEKAELRINFLPYGITDNNIRMICTMLYHKFECGYNMIKSLYDAYMQMRKDKVEYVWVYGG